MYIPFRIAMVNENFMDFDTAARTFMDAAAQRYHQLADAMIGLSKNETAAVFRQLESMEREASQRIFAPPDKGDAGGAPLGWPWVGDDGDLLPEDIVDSVYSLTPVRAINLALYNNRRALRFLTDVLAQTQDDRIRALADRLYQVIFDQVVSLRLERRQAHRRQKVSELDDDLALLLESKKDIERYRRYRDICLERLRDRLTFIARSATADERETMLSLAATIHPSPSPDTENAAEQSVEGNAVAQTIAAVESVFDALLLTAQQSEEEALLRLAQADANKLLPAMRQLHKMRRCQSKLT